jgi:MoaA/NifB/PqqE/SkfB family radical SAM enzyme
MGAQVDGAGTSTIEIHADGHVTYEENLFKGLRGVRRAVSQAMKASKDDYGKILKTLKENKISKRDFDEYVSAVHFRDVLTHNHDKMVRAGEVDQRLADIEQLIQGTKDKKAIQQLTDEETKLLAEKKDLEPYILPKEATPDKIQRVLDRWANTPAMQDAQREFVRAQRKDLEMRVKSGTLSQSQMDAMVSAHPN